MRFTKYHTKGAYHWDMLANTETRYYRYAHRVKDWIKEKNVLDVGAGDGCIASVLGIMGVDDEPEAVRLAQEKGANVILASAYNLPFEDKEFDSVFMGHTLEHIKHPLIVLEEVKRILKQYLYIVSPIPDGRDKFHYAEWNEEQLQSLVESVGFKLSEPMWIPRDDKSIFAKFKKA